MKSTADVLALCDWLARIGGLNPADVAKVAERAGIVPVVAGGIGAADA